MFVKAIEKIKECVRPIYIICRYLGSTEVDPGAATYFLVNNQGYAIMCCHTYENIKNCAKSFDDYEMYKQLLEKAPKHGKKRDEYIKDLNRQSYDGHNTIQLSIRFRDQPQSINVIDACPKSDLLLVKFIGLKGIEDVAPVFKKDTSDIKAGKYLCQSGFAFPDFNNYKYNAQTDRIEWTDSGLVNSLLFNVNGMVARRLGDQLIMTTPGYDYMSGAPVFDTEGRICGMQHAVIHKYTNFNCDKVPVWHEGVKRDITQYPFAHFAMCTVVDSIKLLLRKNNIDFIEE